MSNKNILFWSNKCQMSSALLSIMERENIMRFFYSYCVEADPTKVPKYVTETPTLVIASMSKCYIGGDAFRWVEWVKIYALSMKMKNMSQQYAQGISNNLSMGDASVLGYSEAEMKGISDMFSYYDSENKVNDPTKDDVCAPREYFGVDQLGKENIFTPPQEEKKLDAISSAKLAKQLAEERAKQDATVKKSIAEYAKNLQ